MRTGQRQACGNGGLLQRLQQPCICSIALCCAEIQHPVLKTAKAAWIDDVHALQAAQWSSPVHSDLKHCVPDSCHLT